MPVFILQLPCFANQPGQTLANDVAIPVKCDLPDILVQQGEFDLIKVKVLFCASTSFYGPLPAYLLTKHIV
jgi:hypothetical protein